MGKQIDVRSFRTLSMEENAQYLNFSYSVVIVADEVRDLKSANDNWTAVFTGLVVCSNRAHPSCPSSLRIMLSARFEVAVSSSFATSL